MTITQKGQVTLPAEIRKKYGFLPHTQLLFREEKGRVYLERDTTAVKENNPFDKVKGKADLGLTTEAIMALTRTSPCSL